MHVAQADKREPRQSEWRCDTSLRSCFSAVKQPPFTVARDATPLALLPIGTQTGKAPRSIMLGIKASPPGWFIGDSGDLTDQVAIRWNSVNSGFKPTLQMVIRQGKLHGRLIDEQKPVPHCPPRPHTSLWNLESLDLDLADAESCRIRTYEHIRLVCNEISTGESLLARILF